MNRDVEIWRPGRILAAMVFDTMGLQVVKMEFKRHVSGSEKGNEAACSPKVGSCWNLTESGTRIIVLKPRSFAPVPEKEQRQTESRDKGGRQRLSPI
jgi:hypothetical protein